MTTTEHNASLDIYQELLADFAKLRSDSRTIIGYNEIDKTPQLLNKWLKKAKDLPTPWPQEVLEKLLAHQPDPSNKKSCEFLRWVHKSDLTTNAIYLKALDFAFQAGLSPTTYIARAGVSILGLAAYTSNFKIVELCFKHAPKEDLRLKLLSEHLSPNDQGMVGSTLLHRLMSRHGQRYDYELMIDLIVKKDPEALLQQTASGVYPDQEANHEVAFRCRELRVKMDKEHLLQAVSEVLNEKEQAPVRLHKL